MNQQEIERTIKKINGSMAIEGMPLTDENKEDIRAILSGEKTADEIVERLVKKYNVKPGKSNEQERTL